jgi:putative endonuclease
VTTGTAHAKLLHIVVIPTPQAEESRKLMPREKRYYVYIMASISGVQHKSGETDSFTRRYRIHKLVYYEAFQYVNDAISCETEIKKWRREKKIALIVAQNAEWNDLSAGWGKPAVMRKIPPASLCSASE